jgi:hypothetical protein
MPIENSPKRAGGVDLFHSIGLWLGEFGAATDWQMRFMRA